MAGIVEILNRAGAGFCGFAAAMLLQSGALIVLLYLVDLLIRKRVRAVVRYGMWMLVFVKLVLPPTLCLPTGIGYWCGVDTLVRQTQVSRGVPDAVGGKAEAMGPQHGAEDVRATAAVQQDPMRTEAAGTADAGTCAPPVQGGDRAIASVNGVNTNVSISWQAAAFVGWVVGVVVLSVLLLQRYLFVRGLIAQSEAAGGRVAETLRQCAEEVGVRGEVGLRLCKNMLSPAACGLVRPVILMPGSVLEGLSREKLRAVLVHELAHIKRGDLWVNFAQTVLQIVYFYNPLLWFANGVVRRIREKAVDEMVLTRLGGEAKRYSDILIDVAETAFSRPHFSLRLVGVVESKKALAGRIRHILTRPIPKTARLGFAGLAAVLITAAALLPMAKGSSPSEELSVPAEIAVSGGEGVESERRGGADFEDMGFWQEEIKKYMVAVRTMDGQFVTDMQKFEEGKDEPSHYRNLVTFKWDRDRVWYDYSYERLSNDPHSSGDRWVRGEKYSWWVMDKDVTKTVAKKDGDNVKLRYGFSPEDEWWPGDQMDISYVEELICSGFLRILKYQMQWDMRPKSHRLNEDGNHEVVLMSKEMEGKNGELMMTVEWDGGFKLLNIKGRVDGGPEMIVNEYSDHVKVGESWFARKAIEYSYEEESQYGPEPRLEYKEVVIANRVIFNRVMNAEEFEYVPAVGMSVFDKVEDRHYTAWPDMEKIKATGGKERIKITGMVLLDGKPTEGIAVSTMTRYDKEKNIHRTVESKTDSEGGYELEGLVPGFEYYVTAQTPTGNVVHERVQTAEDGRDYEGLTLKLASGYTLIGEVRLYDGKPAKDAAVKIEGKNEVRTGNDGKFKVTGMKPGGYKLQVAAKGCAPWETGEELVYDEETGEVAPLKVQLEKERVLTGRIVDKFGDGLGGQRLMAFWSCFVGSSWQWCNANTDDQGNFRLGNLGDDTYEISTPFGPVWLKAADSPVLLRTVGKNFALDDKYGRGLVDARTLEIVRRVDKSFIDWFKDQRQWDDGREYNRGPRITQWLGQIKTEDAAARGEAMASLGNLEAVEAAKALDEIIQKGQEKGEILLAIRGLGRIGDVESGRALIGRLDDADEEIAAYARTALAEICGQYFGKDKEAWEQWVSEYGQRRSQLNVMGPDRLLQTCVKAAGDGDIETALAAFLPGSDGARKMRQMLNGGGYAQKMRQYYEAVEWPEREGGAVMMFGDGGKRNEQRWYLKITRDVTIGQKSFESGKTYLVFTGVCRERDGQWWLLDLNEV